LTVSLSIHQFIFPFVHQSISPSISLSVNLPTCLCQNKMRFKVTSSQSLLLVLILSRIEILVSSIQHQKNENVIWNIHIFQFQNVNCFVTWDMLIKFYYKLTLDCFQHWNKKNFFCCWCLITSFFHVRCASLFYSSVMIKSKKINLTCLELLNMKNFFKQ